VTQRDIFIYVGDTGGGYRMLRGKLNGKNYLGDVSMDGIIEIQCIV
jgi:hypothetical protein